MKKIILFTVLFLFTFGLVYANDNTANSNENSQKTPPVVIYSVFPEYPYEARKKHLEGKVLLKMTISNEGIVSDAEVIESSGYDILDEAAINGVKEWRFIPAKENGEAIAVKVVMPITFKLTPASKKDN
ncbi:energy transducer TonB [Sporomusa acidovorans]|uniref:TonB C-terminal domain-containing protein n=2 Tax=Sporomusa TaxID=2375 RepID=A0ABZ3J3R8_SPOA4|nr:energy transducer TonB [Sporomusa acidovorans]OZC20963.1 transport protein TonB [Sporomusa acidovorans DSM 3132]SDE62523.1 TonB family C-terminal domain-containing protein [Sporomusa acidovorans]